MSHFGANIRQLRRMMQGDGPRRGGGRMERAAAELPMLTVEPRLTDPRITDWVEPHLVCRDPQTPANGLLFLFLCGSNGLPSRQTLIMQQAARQGYHAINLRYPNSWTVGGLGRQSNDPDSHEKIRTAIIDGQPCADLPDVREQDGIRNRLIKLLAWLAENQSPDWNEFFGGTTLRWPRMVIAGHSQGGGHAAVLGKREEVSRVIMLGSPVDHIRGVPAPWLSRPGATPVNRYFGFAHTQDQGMTEIAEAWQAIGLAAFGGIVNVDSSLPPYSMTHQLTSNLPVPRDKYHSSVAVDAALPMAGGAPAYLPAWNYLLDPNINSR